MEINPEERVYLLKSIILHLVTKPIKEFNNSQLTDSIYRSYNVNTKGKNEKAKPRE